MKNFPSYVPTIESLGRDYTNETLPSLEHLLLFPLLYPVPSSCMDANIDDILVFLVFFSHSSEVDFFYVCIFFIKFYLIIFSARFVICGRKTNSERSSGKISEES